MTAARLPALAIAVILAAAGCSSAASPGPTGSSPSPGASPLEDATLVFSDQISGDVEGPLPPLELAIYADGRVLWPTWSEANGFVWLEARLSTTGLTDVREQLEATGFFEADVDIAPEKTMDPNLGSGFSGYELALRTDGGLITARTSSIFPTREGQRLIELAERWSDPVTAVPAGSWDPEAPGPIRFEPTHWHLQLYPSAPREEPFPDIAEVRSVLGDPRTLGLPLGPSAEMGRCGVIDSAQVAVLLEFLRQRLGTVTVGHEQSATFAWPDGTGSLDLYLRAALPHQVDRCP